MKQVLAALVFGLAVLSGSLVAAQSVYVQIEARPDLSQAQDRARAYGANLSDVNGFRLRSGWYAIALGPYDNEGAVARMQSLKVSRAIPDDAYLVRRSAFLQQFWPVGAGAFAAAEPAETDAASVASPTTAPAENRAQALAGENRLNRDEKFSLQIALKLFGYYDGAIDAAFGPGTRGAMAAWQTAKSYEPTGVLTTRQRGELTGDYQSAIASAGMAPLRDTVAGIEMQLPQALVAFDRYQAPFVHYTPADDSGVTVLLISQPGDENTLLGLYDIMQSLKIVPPEGERERSSDRFTLTGADERITSYTHAVLKDGAIKGFTLIWPAGQDARRDIVLKAMRDSFTTIDGVVLPDAMGNDAMEQSIDLLGGLQIRQPQATGSGFFVDGRGTVLTTAAAVQNCGRITLDDVYDAQILARDMALGLAVLRPSEPLAPRDFARFLAGAARLNSEIAVAGFSFGGILGAPTLTFGTLADVRGLRGEETLNRLALAANPGDSGGPVFDSSGSVLGMLLPDQTDTSRRLPADVAFATDAAAIAGFLTNSGLAATASQRTQAMPPEELTRQAANLTVLVSCWQE